jgi:rhodanese-related sulfurtransferase
MGYDMSKLVKVPQRPAATPPVGATTPASAAPATPSAERVAEILASVPAVTAEDLKARLSSGAVKPVVLDVRRADEYAAGHVDGALNVAHTDVLANPATAVAAGKDAEIILYCGSGRRASMAIEALRTAGYTNLKHLEGDYPAWSKVTATP